jgi:hypothetical protein
LSDARSILPFFLVIIDHDRGFFSVEGPMGDDSGGVVRIAMANRRPRSLPSGNLFQRSGLS